MKSYEEDFEAAMLEDSQNFYKAKSTEWRNQSTEYFITQAHKFLGMETKMCDEMFEVSSKIKVLDVFYKQVLIDNA